MLDTVMAYKARNKMGRFADTNNNIPSLPFLQNLSLGSRVKVDLSSSGTYIRLGTVRYVGETDFAQGLWVGIEYDEPVGKNDGSVNGTVYFDCRMKHGGFVRPDKCEVGSWPEEEDELAMDTE